MAGTEATSANDESLFLVVNVWHKLHPLARRWGRRCAPPVHVCPHSKLIRKTCATHKVKRTSLGQCGWLLLSLGDGKGFVSLQRQPCKVLLQILQDKLNHAGGTVRLPIAFMTQNQLGESMVLIKKVSEVCPFSPQD